MFVSESIDLDTHKKTTVLVLVLVWEEQNMSNLRAGHSLEYQEKMYCKRHFAIENYRDTLHASWD